MIWADANTKLVDITSGLKDNAPVELIKEVQLYRKGVIRANVVFQSHDAAILLVKASELLQREKGALTGEKEADLVLKELRLLSGQMHRNQSNSFAFGILGEFNKQLS